MTKQKQIPSVSVNYAANGNSKKSNELGMCVMQEHAYEKHGEQYLLIKSPRPRGKSRLDVHCLCLLKGSLLRFSLGYFFEGAHGMPLGKCQD